MPPSPADQPSRAYDDRTMTVAASPDAAARLGAAADVVVAPDAAPDVQPDEEREQPVAPFAATCPTCEKPLDVYVPDAEPAPHNEHKHDTAFCVVCGRRWSKGDLERAGAIEPSGDAGQAEPLDAASSDVSKPKGKDKERAGSGSLSRADQPSASDASTTGSPARSAPAPGAGSSSGGKEA